MNKTERLAFIRNRHAALFGVALATGTIAVTKAEIAAEKKEITSVQAPVETEETETAAVDVAWGAFDKPTVRREKESDYLLTAEERKELARIAAKPATVANEPETKETVLPVDVPEFVPEINPDWDREIASELESMAEPVAEVVN